ncbi:MAG: M20 family metallopeptidase [Chitinophagales bacterium]|nr:M20 family metallopeptidase [Chitinophagales bacterium]
MNIQEYIHQRVREIEDELITTRRYLHAHPELSFNEEKTMLYISSQLTKIGIPHQTHIGGFGIVGIIEGLQPSSKTIALRGDIDALPILEQNNVPYVSTSPGIMHACGHDVHTTNVLGAAKILNEIKEHFFGTIKLIFQPAEEKLPGGASLMIKEGVLEHPSVQTVIGQHVLPQLEVGKIGLRQGVYMASVDEIYITVKGKGGHGAQPNLTSDPIVAASQIVLALQQINSRKANPIIPTVLTIGKFIANGTTNVIPSEVQLEGTFRTFDETWRVEAHTHIKNIIDGIALATETEILLRIEHGYPFLKNDDFLTQQVTNWAKMFIGEENVELLPIRMTSEDFAYYSHKVPSCFYRLGTGNLKKGITSSIHTTTFDIDEAALKIGAGLMAWLAYKQLEFL